ncbi:DUF262 domain-containing protein [Haloferula helveola]|uniref:DUF262 domain-containing protein n=1 Tax=Haloferula helveola TaxID=490095 RepID=A0ABN6H9L7_9BACT|nr:DUF262 domain-containing protein [Haloferula helveola]
MEKEVTLPRSDEFEIQARSCTLFTNDRVPHDVLWRPGVRYRVPIFQRPYSWGIAEVHRLMTDLLMGYFGRNGRIPREQMFIGTMQLSAAETGSWGDYEIQHDIIDGQQRISTLILILKALQDLVPELSIWPRLDFQKRLTTAVSGKIQQDYLQRALETGADDLNDSAELNAYLRNLTGIRDQIRDDDEFDALKADIGSFVDYLCSRVYFVIIETRAPLSKTLQIFDAINTSGMELDGGDVFKIRYFEFLRKREGAAEEVFHEVSALYERIDRENSNQKRAVLEIGEVLALAQQILITDHELSNETRSLAGTTFFERLLDVSLGLQNWENFQPDKCRQVRLPLRFFSDLIGVLIEWDARLKQFRPEADAMIWFIWWSRYGRYHYLPAYFLHRFRDRSDRDTVAFQSELEEFVIELGKLLVVYSLRYQRVTNEGRQKARELMTLMSSNATHIEPTDVIAYLQLERAKCSGEIRERLLTDWIAHIPKAKNLVCRLVAMFTELEVDSEPENLGALLFETPIDIEHIESANHKDPMERERIHQDWGAELHQLGNLTVLEFDLNRSIGNHDYATEKRARYLAESRFRSVQTFAEENAEWNQERARARREALAERLTGYLCGPSPRGKEQRPASASVPV